jgi:hypothetical protein
MYRSSQNHLPSASRMIDEVLTTLHAPETVALVAVLEPVNRIELVGEALELAMQAITLGATLNAAGQSETEL